MLKHLFRVLILFWISTCATGQVVEYPVYGCTPWTHDVCPDVVGRLKAVQPAACTSTVIEETGGDISELKGDRRGVIHVTDYVWASGHHECPSGPYPRFVGCNRECYFGCPEGLYFDTAINQCVNTPIVERIFYEVCVRHNALNKVYANNKWSAHAIPTDIPNFGGIALDITVIGDYTQVPQAVNSTSKPGCKVFTEEESKYIDETGALLVVYAFNHTAKWSLDVRVLRYNIDTDEVIAVQKGAVLAQYTPESYPFPTSLNQPARIYEFGELNYGYSSWVFVDMTMVSEDLSVLIPIGPIANVITDIDVPEVP